MKAGPDTEAVPSNVVLAEPDQKTGEEHCKIDIVGALAEGCEVHVKMQQSPASGTPSVFTSGYSSGGEGETAYKNTENPSVYFKSDDPSCIVDLNTSGEAVLGIPYKITVADPSNGSIAVQDSRTNAAAGSPVAVTASPASGYLLSSISVKKKELTVKKGKTGKIKATVQGVRSDRKVYKPSGLVRYYSSNRKVAAVDKDGTVHAAAAGSCSSYAVTQDGVRTSVKIKVVR